MPHSRVDNKCIWRQRECNAINEAGVAADALQWKCMMVAPARLFSKLVICLFLSLLMQIKESRLARALT
jgi:hypothetical protein